MFALSIFQRGAVKQWTYISPLTDQCALKEKRLSKKKKISVTIMRLDMVISAKREIK